MNKEREKRIKLLKGLTDEQLINELRRRRQVKPNFVLTWLHKDAFYNTGESIKDIAEAVSKEAEQEAKEKELKEKLKTDK